MCTSGSSSEDESDAIKASSIDAKLAQKKRVWSGSKDSGKHSFSSSPTDPTTATTATTTTTTLLFDENDATQKTGSILTSLTGTGESTDSKGPML